MYGRVARPLLDFSERGLATRLIKLLTDKAYPDLENKARECLTLNHYLGQIENPQVAFSVRQRQPTSLVEAVSATIEMESYLQPRPGCVAQIEPEQGTESVIAAIQHQQRALAVVLDKVIERLEKLEAKGMEQSRVTTPKPNQAGRRIVVCRKCHRQGHYAQGCASLPLTLPMGADQGEPACDC